MDPVPDTATKCKVTMRCPSCGKEKRVNLDDGDPSGTAIVETECPKCVDGGFSYVRYYDADGEELFQ
jgi:hypothetical protein